MTEDDDETFDISGCDYECGVAAYRTNHAHHWGSISDSSLGATLGNSLYLISGLQ